MDLVVRFHELRDRTRQRISQGGECEPADRLGHLVRIVQKLETGIKQHGKLEQLAVEIEADLDGDLISANIGQDTNITGPQKDTRRKRSKEKAIGARNQYLQQLQRQGIRLRKCRQGERIYETETGKLVAIAAATEGTSPSDNKWWLGLPDKEYDIVVLLCLTDSGELLDFVFPREFVEKIWSQLSRDYNHEVKFHVVQSGVNYELIEYPSSTLNQYLSRLELFQ